MAVPILLQTRNTRAHRWAGVCRLPSPWHSQAQRGLLQGSSNRVLMFGPPEPEGAPHEQLLNQILNGKVPATLSHGQYLCPTGVPISQVNTKKHREGDSPDATAGQPRSTFSAPTSFTRQTLEPASPPVHPPSQRRLLTAFPTAVTVRESHRWRKSLDSGIRQTWVQILVPPFTAVWPWLSHFPSLGLNFSSVN